MSVHEIGNTAYDPVTGQWILTYTGEDVSGIDKAGAALSSDGLSWTAHGSNPISGATNAEDPYIAIDQNGEVFRDSEGRALMFAEEKTSATAHRGINLFKSGVNTLTGWTLFGRVLDKGSVGQWDEADVTSPVVIYDGTQLVMLYEGRSTALAGEAGSIGLATSSDEGETWTKAAANPIIDRADVTWATSYIVCDDVVKVGSSWYLTAHGAVTVGESFHIGRWTTTDAPGAWDDTSWSEMTGNPFDAESNTMMLYGYDPAFVLVADRIERSIHPMVVVDA